MQISVVERTGQLTEGAKEYAREKAGKLGRFYDRIDGIEIIVTQESQRFVVEMIVTTDHWQKFVASEAHDDVHASVDLVIDKMERQLVRHKEKLRNRKHPDQ